MQRDMNSFIIKPSRPALRYVFAAVLAGIALFLLTREGDNGPVVTLPTVRLFTPHLEEPEFNQAFLASDINGEFDPSGIQKLCADKKWKHDLVIECDPPKAGYTNVRNSFMSCLRFAIEAGAAGFIVPQLIPRSQTDLLAFDKNKAFLPFETLFDTDHFVTSLELACPQMHVYRTLDEVKDHTDPVLLPPFSIITDTKHTMPIHDPDALQWGAHFDSWMEDLPAYTPATAKVAVITLEATLLGWPVNYDAPGFRDHIGRVFVHRPDVRLMAAEILYAMSERFGVSSRTLVSDGISPGLYYGAHLRVEKDALDVNWPAYGTMAPKFIEDARAHKLKLMYVASGSEKDIEQLKRDAWKAGEIMVVSKLDLLSPERVEKLQSMTFDELALLDYEILVRSSRFGGTEHTSFSWNIALRRHVVAERVRAAAGRKKKIGANGKEIDPFDLQDGETYRDEYSILYGDKGGSPMFYAGLWP